MGSPNEPRKEPTIRLWVLLLIVLWVSFVGTMLAGTIVVAVGGCKL